MTFPEVGRSSPASILSRVVLPQPLGPTITENSLAKKSRETSLTARIVSSFWTNDLLRLLMPSLTLLAPEVSAAWFTDDSWNGNQRSSANLLFIGPQLLDRGVDEGMVDQAFDFYFFRIL